MKTLVLLAVGLMLCSTPVFAGEYLMNDTGETVTGLRVVFSEPVSITGFGDVLLSVDPQGESIEFIFSGGELEAWGGHWLNWEPTTATLVEYEWLDESPPVPAPIDAPEVQASDVLSVVVDGTLGAVPFQSGGDAAGAFSWSGYLSAGQPTEIRIEVYDESYLHERHVGGVEKHTIVFLVFHDDPSGWGSAIQNASIETFTGPGGYVEKTYVPVTQEQGEWVGKVAIIPSMSMRAISVWKHPNSGTVHFGVNVAEHAGRAAQLPSNAWERLGREGLQKAESLHSAAWEEMVRKSAIDPYYKYGLYAARSLAVTYPEIYLQADALFLDHVGSNSGFAAAFAETDPHSASYSPNTFFSGAPFSFDLVDLDAYQTMANTERFPSEVAVFEFLDQRLLSLASCLKDKDRRITSLEKATILYFKLCGQSSERPFIVYCDDETVYVASQDRMLSIDGGTIEGKLGSDVVLIFNEDFVWYPLMGRDDTTRDRSLRDLVAEHGTEGALPTVSAQEHRLVQTLRTSTVLDSAKERDLARLAAVKGSPWVEPFRRISEKYLPNYPSDIWIFAIQQHWVHCANSISPWTSWLAAYVLDSTATDRGVETMTGVWQGQLDMVHGHAWQCNLVRYTIDESVSIGAVHCVLHANCLSSVLDLAGVNNIIIQGSPGPPGEPDRTHTYVALPEVGIVLSNGEVTERGTVIDESSSTLYYVSSGENWAFPYIGSYVGTWSPSDVALEFESIEEEYGNRFHGFRCRGTGSGRFQRTVVVSKEYLADLPSEQRNWRPFEHP